MDELIQNIIDDAKKINGMTVDDLKRAYKEQREGISDQAKVGGTVATTTRMLYEADKLINIDGNTEKATQLIRRCVSDLLSLANEFGVSTEKIAMAVEITNMIMDENDE